MARSPFRTLAAAGRDARGFTLLELMTVLAVLGVVVTLAFPSLRKMNREQKTKSSATQMAGVLENARSLSVSEGTPHLVFVNAPSDDGSGGCGAVAVVVRDSDRNYAISDGDRQQEISLGPDACGDVKLYAQDDSARPFENLQLPAEDNAVRSGPGPASSGPLGEESGPKGKAPKPDKREMTIEAAVVNGSTFPVDEASGRPVIAFSERGIPVDPQNPTRWGSGAGAIYLTDGSEAVYAAVVQPMGEIKLRKYKPAADAWE